MSDVIDETTLRRLDGVATPVQQVPLGGHQRVLGFRDGIAAAVVVVVLALAGGVIGFPALQSGALAPASPTSPMATAPGSGTLPSPSPTQQVTAVATPAYECRPAATGDPLTALLRVGPGGATVPGRLVEAGAPSFSPSVTQVDVISGTDLQVVLGARHCALAWEIAFGSHMLEQRPNPNLDPAYAAQNVFHASLTTGRALDDILTAKLTFAAKVVTFAWRLHLVPYTANPIRLEATDPVADGGFDLATVDLAGDCLQTEFTSGASAVSGTCTLLGPPADMAVLNATPAARIAVTTSDTFLRTTDPADTVVECGTIDPASGLFQADRSCDLRFDDVGGFGFDMPAAPNIWVIRLSGCVVGDVATTCGKWWAIVDTASAGWTPLPIPG